MLAGGRGCPFFSSQASEGWALGMGRVWLSSGRDSYIASLVLFIASWFLSSHVFVCDFLGVSTSHKKVI